MIGLSKALRGLADLANRALLSLAHPRIELGKKIRVRSMPVIIQERGTHIAISDRVMLNSSGRLYHGNMLGRVKLYTEGSGAIISIGEDTRIHGSCVHARSAIRIGKRCLIAANTNILDSNGHSTDLHGASGRLDSVDDPRPIEIGDDVWIGMNCVILAGTTIGNGSIIGANSVVRGSIPSDCIAAGNPIAIVKILRGT